MTKITSSLDKENDETKSNLRGKHRCVWRLIKGQVATFSLFICAHIIRLSKGKVRCNLIHPTLISSVIIIIIICQATKPKW